VREFEPHLRSAGAPFAHAQRGLAVLYERRELWYVRQRVFVLSDDELPRNESIYQGRPGHAYMNPDTPPRLLLPFRGCYFSQERHGNIYANAAILAQPYYYFDTNSASFVYGHQEVM